ncbi:alpha/beta hydrolase [Roseomonas gilardii subsp. gilardii]|uniref:alpha/beta fold hydrolase n=1 Tax=Roseomonas gilardii TaxID=257708 RepID=UPI001FF9449C|nr:alpha/beta fold hydrolase [Roseomonas gilardii]UPG71444.1 alpha/beta hydrolase [Roseomonas gilardii subsp. gilardii]
MSAPLGMPRVVTVGTSFGGLLSMFLALQRPAMLRGVVLNDIGPRVESGGLGRVRDFLGLDPAFATEAEAAQYLRKVLPQLTVADEAGWLRLAARTYQRGPDGRLHPRWDLRIAQAMEAKAPVTDFGPLFSGLGNVPAMLVWGERSELLSADTVNRMRREKPDLELVVHPHSGHAPLLEEPEIVPRLDAFLDRLA